MVGKQSGSILSGGEDINSNPKREIIEGTTLWIGSGEIGQADRGRLKDLASSKG